MHIRRIVSGLPYALIPLACFFAIFHPATLNVANAGWLIRGSDNGENALGLHAWLHDSRAGITPHTNLLGAPEGVSLLFTDSNPLVALLASPFSAWLPVNSQFVGPWVLLCFVLQTVFASALLRRFAPNAASLWIGTALIVALPTLFNRFVHTNLMAHWLILWALWLFIEPRRARSFVWWTPLLFITALVHSYLLVMVGAIWASAMGERFLAAADWAERGRLAAGSALAFAGVILIALWLGAGGSYQVTGSYGAFAMPLDALWNPGNPDYSHFLPAIGQREGRGFEGFQYLGLGLLLLMPIALYAALREPMPTGQRTTLRRLRWLLPALALLTLVAISNFPDFAGQRLIRFPLPDFMAPLLDMVRASGRLFWPAAYVLVFVAILAVYRLPRQRSARILGCLLALQLLDISGMFGAIRATLASAGDDRLHHRLQDPRWFPAIASARDIAFVPADVTQDLPLFQEVAWHAAIYGRPVRSVYAARTPISVLNRQREENAAFARGELAQGRLYILSDRTPIPQTARGRMLELDNVRIVLPPSR